MGKSIDVTISNIVFDVNKRVPRDEARLTGNLRHTTHHYSYCTASPVCITTAKDQVRNLSALLQWHIISADVTLDGGDVVHVITEETK